jgi:hypothetical protein
LLFTAVLFVGAWAVASLAIAQGPDLKSSLDFIHSFVEQNGFYQISGPHGRFTSERDRIVFKGCKVTVHVVSVVANEPSYKKESVNFDILFSLKDMDPEVAASPKDLNGNSLPDNREWVILRAANDSDSILVQSGSTSSSISALPLQGGANHEETQKLADAFHSAISLCSQGK